MKSCYRFFKIFTAVIKKTYVHFFYNGSYSKYIFNKIFIKNKWKSSESISGSGSELDHTKEIRKELEKLVRELEIKVLLDVPCGDFNWMREVNLSEASYIGGDIVQALVALNKRLYSSDKRSFIVIDITKDSLPKACLVVNRDCLVHLSYKDINDFLQNLKASSIKYILTTTFTDRLNNSDILTGKWRPINLQHPPFNFPKPRLLINEKFKENNGLFQDKSLALYCVKDLPDSLQGF